MKKTILAAAVAAAVMAAPMTASAGVTIYGKIHASIDYVSGGSILFPDHAWETDSNWYVTNRTSRIGFKGSEDLGNGLQAIWKAEIGYNLDTGGWGAGRNSYIGLAGDWGTVLIGRHDTPLKISTGRLDVFADTMADYNSLVGFTDRRASNVLAYISPNWNGFTLAAAAVAPEDPNILGFTGWNGASAGYSIAAMYFNNGFYGSLAYEDVGDLYGSLANDDIGIEVPSLLNSPFLRLDKDQTWRLGLGYIMNAFTVGFVYEQQKTNFEFFDFELDAKKWMISGAYDFGNNTVKAMYGQFDLSGPINLGPFDGKQDAWAIGLDHKLSVRTKVYALYADSDLGLHDHNRVGTAPILPGTAGVFNQNGFSMGMVHTF